MFYFMRHELGDLLPRLEIFLLKILQLPFVVAVPPSQRLPALLHLFKSLFLFTDVREIFSERRQILIDGKT
ncbi:MAG: hypothetical protein BGP24_07740 [Lysobacterales bacterium 69-70]|nr:MAG: hypothetical protein BGP24_07740 [Xanthomonadales bacterium 69-70]